jgi:hypothetical protein
VGTSFQNAAYLWIVRGNPFLVPAFPFVQASDHEDLVEPISGYNPLQVNLGGDVEKFKGILLCHIGDAEHLPLSPQERI